MDLKIENIIRNGTYKPYLTKFLTIQEQSDLEKFNKEVNIVFSNTYIDEERKRACVYPKDIEITPDFKISYLEIISKNKLRHPDILGAILNLGVDREVIGDILASEQIVLCMSEIENYIISNLTRIGRENVEVRKRENLNYSVEDNYTEKEIIISSPRLDGIIAKAMNLSRSRAQEIIRQRLVKVNGQTEVNCDYICIESDIVSVTRLGRIKIVGITRKTKKDKLVLNVLLIKV